MSIFTNREENFFQLDPTGQHINTFLITKEKLSQLNVFNCCTSHYVAVHGVAGRVWEFCKWSGMNGSVNKSQLRTKVASKY